MRLAHGVLVLILLPALTGAELAQRSQSMIDLALRLDHQATAAAVSDLAHSGAQLRWQLGLTAALIALAGGFFGWTLMRGFRALHRRARPSAAATSTTAFRRSAASSCATWAAP